MKSTVLRSVVVPVAVAWLTARGSCRLAWLIEVSGECCLWAVGEIDAVWQIRQKSEAGRNAARLCQWRQKMAART